MGRCPTHILFKSSSLRSHKTCFHLTLLFIAIHIHTLSTYNYVHISEFKMRTDIPGYNNVQESVYEYTGPIVEGAGHGHVCVHRHCVHTAANHIPNGPLLVVWTAYVTI